MSTTYLLSDYVTAELTLPPSVRRGDNYCVRMSMHNTAHITHACVSSLRTPFTSQGQT